MNENDLLAQLLRFHNEQCAKGHHECVIDFPDGSKRCSCGVTILVTDAFRTNTLPSPSDDHP